MTATLGRGGSQICKGELVQIIGRLPGVNRTEDHPVDVLVMTDVPLPLPVDETISAADLAPTPGELIWPRGRAYPALWRNADAAGQAFHRARFVTNPKKRNLYPGMSRTSGTEAVPGLIEMAEAFVAVERDIETWQRGIAISESSRSPSCKEA